MFLVGCKTASCPIFFYLFVERVLKRFRNIIFDAKKLKKLILHDGKAWINKDLITFTQSSQKFWGFKANRSMTMRKVDESRAANYIRKHSNYKKWLAFVLCLSLLTGTVTLYILNKPATAMTAEGAEGLGVVLETASDADEQVLIQQTIENKSGSDGEDDDDLFSEFDEDDDDKDDNDDNDDVDEPDKSVDGEETKEDLVEEEVKEGETKEGEEEKEKTEEETELTEDVVLTLSYVDEDGEAIADEKEIDIDDSIDLTSDAPSFEGYTFKEATFKGDVITKVAVKKNADDIRYYEVTFDDDETKEITKDATVVLTYIKDEEEEEEEVDASVTLTAKYVDKDGEDIQDSEEISFAKETSINKDNAPEIDGYFFMKAVYDGQEIVKIAPVEAEAEAEDSDNEEETTEETEEVKSVSVEGYEFTTADGDTVEITEDAEIEYTYVKASEETEFTYSDGKVTVTATINGKNVFPEGIALKAAEVTKDSSSYNYDAYMDALNENAEAIAEEAGQDKSSEFTENNTILYDIAFVYEGKEIQPKEGTVSVKIEFKNNQLSQDLAAVSKEEIAVVHLPIKENVKEENEIVSTAEAVNITADDIDVITLSDATAAVEEKENVEFEAESFSIFAVRAYQSQDYGTDTFETVLGDAVNFAVVADKFYMNEAQTNFAVNEICSTEAQSGCDITNKTEQTIIIAKSNVKPVKIKGYPAYVIVPEEYKECIEYLGNTALSFDTSFKENQVRSIVNAMMEYTRSASDDLANRPDSRNVKIENKRLDIKELPNDATYYVTLTDSDLDALANSGELRIYKKDNQTIVFNIPKKDKVTINSYYINDQFTPWVSGDDKQVSPEYAKYARTLIWNFTDVNTVETTGAAVGVFISGNSSAKWINYGTSAGWVVFPEVKIDCGEWHNTYDHLEKISEKAYFEAYKHIDGKPAIVSGFSFSLFRKDASGNWEQEPIQTKYNNRQNVVFDPIEYGDDKAKDNYQNRSSYQYLDFDDEQDTEPKTYYYKMVENAQSESDPNYAQTKNFSIDDSTVYAKVTVTKSMEIANPGNKKQYYRVTPPKYYSDEACTQPLDVIPTFDNTSVGTISFNLLKYLNNQPPEKMFDFNIRVLDSTKENGAWVSVGSVKNNGVDISYHAKTTDIVNGKKLSQYINDDDNSIIFLVEESDITDNPLIQKDSSSIIVKVYNPGKDSEYELYYRMKSLDKWEWNPDQQSLLEYVENSIGNAIAEDITEFPAFYNRIVAKATIQVKKNFIGGTWPAGLGFMFTIAAKEGIKVQNTGDETEEISIATNDIPTPNPKIEYVYGDGSSRYKDVIFKDIVYDTPGTYKYEISEEPECYTAEGYEISISNDDIQFDAKKIYVKVTVTSDMNTTVQYYSDEKCEHTLEGNGISFNNELITQLTIKKVWKTPNGDKINDSQFTTPIYVQVWRSLGENAKKELLKWDTANKVSYLETASSVLMLSSENHWQVELVPDKVHPEGSNEYYRYYVQEIIKKDNDKYVDKTEFVTYSSSYNLSDTDWNAVYAYADSSKDPMFTLTVTNEIGSNVLPSAGGMGDIPYMATGVGTAVAGLLGAKAYSRKKKKDDEEE